MSSISVVPKTRYSINLQELSSSSISKNFKLHSLVEGLLVPLELELLEQDDAHCLESEWAQDGMVNQARPVF